MGVPYPLMDLDRRITSGTIPAGSKEKDGPVRPQPIWMSSTTRSAPCFRVQTAFGTCR